jgi:chromosome segregation ATPase
VRSACIGTASEGIAAVDLWATRFQKGSGDKMISSNRSIAPLFGKSALVLVLALAAMTGCSATEQKNSAAKGAFRNFRKSVDRMDMRVDGSVRAMDRLQSTKTVDNDAAYWDFVTEYFNIAADAAGVRENAEFMRDAGLDYFLVAERAAKAEDNEKTAAHIRSRAEAVKPKYDQVQASLGAARDAYKPYQAAVATVAKSLNKDHSPARIAAISDQFTTAKQRAADLKTAIANLRKSTDAMEKNLEETK